MSVSCLNSSFTQHWSFNDSLLSNKSVDTKYGPIGPKVSNDLPKLNCGGVAWNWTGLSDISCPTHKPATWSHATSLFISFPPLPITKTIDEYYAEVQKMGGQRWDTSSLIKRFRK